MPHVRRIACTIAAGFMLGEPPPASALQQDSLSFRSVAAGATHTCALTTGGEAYCWGDNLEGELGTGDRFDATVPTPVSGANRYLAIDAGVEFTCGLATTGQAYCWGRNDTYALGNGAMQRSFAPVLVTGGQLFRAVAAGGDHACGVAIDGTAYCWGSNAEGQLGTGDTLSSPLPLPVAGSLRFLSITAGDDHTCALTVDSLAYCWGSNRRGQLGTGRRDKGSTPQPVAYRRHWRVLSAGARHTCGIAVDDRPTAYCWGDNFHGQSVPFGYRIGYRTLWAPTFAGDGSDLVGVSAGRWHTCYVWRRSLNTVRCVGANFDGQLGTDLYGHYVHVSAGDAHTCALRDSGAVYCWGRNAAGQLGDGTHLRQERPVRVSHPAALAP
jgi:alpha-tubulin suppressor-like RCC1 family protein